MTDTLQTAELREKVTKMVTDMTVSKTLSEEFLIDELLALINSEVTKKLEAVLAVLPEKTDNHRLYIVLGDRDRTEEQIRLYAQLRQDGHNKAIDQVTTAITNLVEGSRASSRINPSVRTTLNTEGKSVA